MNEFIPKISVVIPVYNVEPYIDRCVESVLEQTIKDVEIILVDDGSPDNCPAICDEYSKKHNNIVVFHKKNGGLSSARNVGIKNAKGKYLFFLDSDDWLDKDGLERLYTVAERENVDFVRYRSFRTGWPDMEENTPTYVEKERELTGGYYSAERIKNEILPRLFATPQLTLGPIVGAWGSLYRTSLLKDNNIYFNEKIRYSEDIPFSAEVVLSAENFYFIDEPGTYHYCYNQNSISKSFKKNRWDSCKEIIRNCEELADTSFEKQINYLRWFCILLALNERVKIHSIREKKKYCKRILDDDEISKAKLMKYGLKINAKQRFFMFLVKMKFVEAIVIV